jgi:uncharacterized RDD family membrane protein YckC
MKWYYADAGRQVGPIEESELDDLVRAGTVRDDTLVWREGLANWQSHASVRGARPVPPMPNLSAAAGTRFCSECGRPFSPDQLVMVGNAAVCATCKPIFMQRMREGGQAVAGSRRYAGFWIRFVARLIDGVILAVVGLIIRIPFGVSMLGLGARPGSVDFFPMMIGMMGIASLLQLAIGIAYEVYFLSTRGATLGKQALGLRVIRTDGSGISPSVALGRYFSQWISAFILMIGYIMAGFDEEKRALHDRICDTRVIYNQ